MLFAIRSKSTSIATPYPCRRRPALREPGRAAEIGPMTDHRPVPSRPLLRGAVVLAALLALLTIAGAASAKAAPRFHRGHLPAIGEIKLVKERHGLVKVTVPV